MKKVKALLYCTKAKPYLDEFQNLYAIHKTWLGKPDKPLNGKIVAKCDIETEELFVKKDIGWTSTSGMTEEEILHKSQLQKNKLNEYLGDNGYALHISNLEVFDKPQKYQDDYLYRRKINTYFYNDEYFRKAPQNMMKVIDAYGDDEYVLISIRPEWLCKILNGEKTIEVRKKVLKEMIDNSI